MWSKEGREIERSERIGQGWTWGHVADQDRDSRNVLTRAVTQLRGTIGVKFRHLGSRVTIVVENQAGSHVSREEF